MTKYSGMILDLVLSSYDHPTAEQIFFRLREKAPRVSMATVYNNLKNLSEDGRIRRLSFDGSPDRFDRPTKHDHMVCVKCGRIFDESLGDLTEELSRRAGRPVVSYDLKIRCFCEECSRALS